MLRDRADPAVFFAVTRTRTNFPMSVLVNLYVDLAAPEIVAHLAEEVGAVVSVLVDETVQRYHLYV